MASRPRALTLSSMVSRESLSYTASKTPMGILRREDVSEADLAAVFAALPTALLTFFSLMKPAAPATAGAAAARRPPPVAARKCLRCMPEVTRELSIFGGLRIKNFDVIDGNNATLYPLEASGRQ